MTPPPPKRATTVRITPGQPIIIKSNRFARYRKREKGERNKTEAAYEAHLEQLKKAGEIQGYMFEPIKLRLADNTYYIPDFLVFAADGVVELHDTKGSTKKTMTDGSKVSAPWTEEDAKIKMKVIAEMYPFRVFVVWKNGAVWEKKEY